MKLSSIGRRNLAIAMQRIDLLMLILVVAITIYGGLPSLGTVIVLFFGICIAVSIVLRIALPVLNNRHKRALRRFAELWSEGRQRSALSVAIRVLDVVPLPYGEWGASTAPLVSVRHRDLAMSFSEYIGSEQSTVSAALKEMAHLYECHRLELAAKPNGDVDEALWHRLSSRIETLRALIESEGDRLFSQRARSDLK